MRTFILLLIVFASAEVKGQDAKAPPEPKKLVELRDRFRTQAMTHEKKWQTDYSAALKTLQDELTKAGDLDSALAVRAEIRNLAEKPHDEQRLLVQRLTGATFSWEYAGGPRNETIAFAKDGFVTNSRWDSVGRVKWIVVDNHTVVLRITELKVPRGDQIAVLVFDDSAKTYRGWGFQNNELVGKRLP